MNVLQNAWCRVFPEKLTVVKLLKIFAVFMDFANWLLYSQISFTGSYSESHKSNQHITSLISALILSSHLDEIYFLLQCYFDTNE
jgi:hypothetical protein